MSHATTFAELLRRYRVSARLSQEELAERAGLSARAISDLERGPGRAPRNATVRLLAEALGLSQEEQTAFEMAARGEAMPTQPPPSPSHNPPLQPTATSHNLPLQLTPLIGREREVEEVGGMLLRPEVRLLTLTGPGGTGKTRLALRAAEELAGEFADGVRFVPLAPTTEPELVAVAIGQAVRVQEKPARSLTESLEEHLRDHQMLLVLDNFEQVVSAAPLIARLLVACAHLKVLATSRVVLRVTGEQTYPVSPLQLPDPKLTRSVEQVQESEAVRLFVARAQAAKPGFGLTEGNAPTVAELCRGLDGLPLAIELAAARVRLLSPQAMLPRLGNKLALLTGGAQDLPARQQTVRATLDWSYDLLDEPERRLLRRLSVFAGGCTLEAAEAVCGPEGEMDVFGGVSSLVDGSLLRQEEGANGEARLWMLETIREYALARLAESGEEDRLRRRHAEHYLALVEGSEPELAGVRQAEWLERMEGEYDNLRAVLGWSQTRGDADLALSLGGALWRYWFIRGHFEEWGRWLAGVESLVPGDAAGAVGMAKALFGKAVLLLREEYFDQAASITARSLDLYRTAGDKWGTAARLVILGKVASLQSEEAWEHGRLAQGVRLAREVGEPWLLGWALFNVAETAWSFSEYAPATAFLEESLAICRKAGDRQGVAWALSLLGWLVVRHASDYERAAALLGEARAMYAQMGDRLGNANALLGLAMVALSRGDHAAARSLTEERLAVERELGNRHGIGHSEAWLGVIASAQGDHSRAEAHWEQSLAIYREMGEWATLAWVLNHMGWSALDRGLYEQARGHLEDSLALSRDNGDRRGVAHVLGGLGALAWTEGQYAQARECWEESLALWRELGGKRGVAAALAELAKAARARRDDAEARAFQMESRALRRELGDRQVNAEWQGVWRDWRR